MGAVIKEIKHVEKQEKQEKQLNPYIKYSSLTTQMAAIIAAGAFFGDLSR